MKKYIINGGKELKGKIKVSGAKNVALKVLVAACLTGDEVEILNIPLISDLFLLIKIVEEIGGKVELNGHNLKLRLKKIKSTSIPLEIGAKIRTSSLFLPMLLSRSKKAIIPNPGGCRIGARPIDRHIEGLKKMGAHISYYSRDGYFHAETKGLHGATYRFEKNSHTGTEALIIAGVLAKGKTIIENAALEPEVDDLINFLNQMGAKIKRDNRKILIQGVKKLHGTSYKIMPDRNEVITLAIASALTGGKILVEGADMNVIKAFLDEFQKAGGSWQEQESFVRFYAKDGIKPTDVATSCYPGFMTDWQGPWAIFMTQAQGVSTIHETIYENRFGYIEELKKMGAKIDFFNPQVAHPRNFYNFNYEKDDNIFHAVRIYGKQNLHEAVLTISDLRAGATLIIAALISKGKTIIYGVEQAERGYEDFSKRLKLLGADIKVVEEEK